VKRRKKEYPDDAAFKEMINSTNMSKEKIREVLFQMLSNTFLVKDLKKIYTSNDPQFIIDDRLMYLKVKKTAFRV